MVTQECSLHFTFITEEEKGPAYSTVSHLCGVVLALPFLFPHKISHTSFFVLNHISRLQLFNDLMRLRCFYSAVTSRWWALFL